jgi:hypothetical protein
MNTVMIPTMIGVIHMPMEDLETPLLSDWLFCVILCSDWLIIVCYRERAVQRIVRRPWKLSSPF